MPRRRHRRPLLPALVGAVLLGALVASLRHGAGLPGGDAGRVPGDASGSGRARLASGGEPAAAPAAGDGPAERRRSARAAPGRTILFDRDAPPVRDGVTTARAARLLLDAHRDELGLAALRGDLELEREMDSLSGHHVRFVQAVHGVPVFGSRVSSHVRHDGRPLLLRADVYPLAGIGEDPADVAPRIAAGEAAFEAIALAGDDDEPDGAAPARVTHGPELVILPRGREGVLAWHVGVRSADETLRVFVDARDGGVLAVSDARVAAEGRGLVFVPNPVHTSGNGTLNDQDDSDQGALTKTMELVTLERLDGSGYLRGAWADLRDSPVSTFRADLDWSWVNRSHHAFEQVNAYYHVDRVQARLQALGIVNANAESQRIDAHAFDRDQSIYDIFDDRLEFGDGGVDDGEDGDVVVHEYGHALQFDQVGSFGLTDEGGAMGEGFGDFLACLMHESARPAWDPLFASWDATAIVRRDPPYLRRVDRDKVFPDDYEDQVHDDGEIWSRFLMDLRRVVGADDALRVVVESHFFLTPNARFKHGCDAVLVANIAVRDGRDDATIRALMDVRGLPYTVPAAPLPDEEEFEADLPEEAATLPPGVYPRLLLADDDYVRVVVPPLRRLLVRVDHDPVALDIDVVATTPDGRVAAAGRDSGGFEEIELAAGTTPAEYVVRIFNAAVPGEAAPGAYDLVLADVPLEAFGPKQTLFRALEPGATWAFRVSVAPSKALERARLEVVTRKPKRGAATDLLLLRPNLVLAVGVDDARRKKGGKAVVEADEAGDWIGVVRPREGQSGPAKLKIKLR